MGCVCSAPIWFALSLLFLRGAVANFKEAKHGESVDNGKVE